MICGMKFKANILIITLFLLMMSSLSALLVSAYINNLIKLSASFHDYYKSYYVANAWLELALVKTNGKVRKYGFEDTVVSWSTTVTNNFSGSFASLIRTSSTSLWDTNTSNPDNTDTCSAETVTSMWYEIPPGWCVPIILLQDNSTIVPSTYNGNEWYVQSISDDQLKSVQDTGLSSYPSLTVYGTTWFTSLVTRVDDDLNFLAWWSTGISSAIAANGQTNILSVTAWWDPQFINGGKYMLMIANTDPLTTWYYCIQSNISVPIPTQYVTISSQWSYRNTTLDLQWVRKAWLPADFCYTAISG